MPNLLCLVLSSLGVSLVLQECSGPQASGDPAQQSNGCAKTSSQAVLRLHLLLCLCSPVEVGLFHGILRKAFHRRTHGTLWRSKIYFGYKATSLSLLHLSVCGKSPSMSLARRKQRPVSRVSVSHQNLSVWS